MAPPADSTGYVMVVLAVGDDDAPLRDPQEVAMEIANAGIEGVVQVETLFSDGYGNYHRYGASVVV